MYLKCFVLGNETKVHGETRIRNVSNGKTIRQAIYNLYLFVAVFGGLVWLMLRVAVYAISTIPRTSIVGCKPYVHLQWHCRNSSHGNHWLQILCSFSMRFVQYPACKSLVANAMFVPNEFMQY